MRKDIEEIFSQRKIDLIHSAYVVHTLYQQQKLGKYCDLKVLVGDKQYFVHRCILAAASAQLDSQINGLDTIQLVGVTYYGFECLLEILYSGKLCDISSLSDSRFQQIVSAADALNAETVMEYCTRERGDLMNLLLRQSNAANTPRQDELSQNDEAKSSGTMEDLKVSVHNSNNSIAAKSQSAMESPENTSLVEYRNSVVKIEASRDVDQDYAEGPVAAEVEVDSIQKTEESSMGLDRDDGVGFSSITAGCLLPPGGPRHVEVEAGEENEEDDDEEGDIMEADEDYESETGMTCRVCRAVFLNTSDLKLHMHTHIGENLFRCEICGLHFKFQSDLWNHKKLHCSCHVCGQEFKMLKDLQLHMEESHPGQLPSVPQYSDDGSTEQRSSRMSKRKTGLTPSMARNKSAAGKPAINPVIVNEIMRGQNGKYQCPLCDRGFDRRWNLKCHILIHTTPDKQKKPNTVTEPRYAEAVFTCPECGKLFRNLHNLRRHASSMHGMNANDLEEAAEGPVGEYSVTTKKLKKEVPEQPSEDYKFWCSVCGRGFKRNRNLRGHMETHQSQGVAKYACHVCNRKFAQKESLNGHLWVHKPTKHEVKEEFP